MERKELMVEALEKNPSPADEVSAEFSVDEDRVSSDSDRTLNASPVRRHHRHHARDELSPKEFFELLSKQVRLQSLSQISPTLTSGGGSQGSFSGNHSMTNECYHSVAIDQCDITSSLDYGSRDYYYPSKITSTSNLCEENDSGEEHNDTRGNWWQGSVYY